VEVQILSSAPSSLVIKCEGFLRSIQSSPSFRRRNAIAARSFHVLVLLLLNAWDAGAEAADDVRLYGGLLAVTIVCGAAGMRCWRHLQTRTGHELVSISPLHRDGQV
jgi:hypothetical protein